MQVTANDMKAAGYRVSLQMNDTEVQRAVDDVVGAYLEKVCEFDDADTDQREAAMSLAYVLLLRRHAVATRSGGKTKLSPSMSENAEPTKQDLDRADMQLRKVMANEGILSKQVDDIAGIYYRNTFLGL